MNNLVSSPFCLSNALARSRRNGPTGEITLTGLVLPIVGVKEKVLAARNAGIRQVILPRANDKDVPELPEDVRRDVKLAFAERIEEVLATALPGLPKSLSPAPVPWPPRCGPCKSRSRSMAGLAPEQLRCAACAAQRTLFRKILILLPRAPSKGVT